MVIDITRYIGENQAKIIMVKGKKIVDYLILLAKCVAIREAMVMAIQRNFKRHQKVTLS